MLDLAACESRAARRLARLFRVERNGAFARFPAETVWRLIDRRAALMAELSGLEHQRRTFAGDTTPELEAALDELAREVVRSRAHGKAKAAELEAELDTRRGGGAATGLRDGGGSRLLGRG